MGAKVQMVPYRAGSGKKDNTKQWQCNLHQLLATLVHYKMQLHTRKLFKCKASNANLIRDKTKDSGSHLK